MATDLAPQGLRPFEIPDSPPADRWAVPVPPSGPAAEELVFDGTAWVVDRLRSVVCRVDELAYRLELGGIGNLWVAPDGRTLGCSTRVEDTDAETIGAAAIGPALMVALALQGVFCLHASAIELETGLCALAGQSGAGKSTLARGLGALRALDGRRAGDDILPLDLASSGPTARTDFPQLKLPDAEQPFAELPPSLPLRAVFLLTAPRADTEEGEVAVERLGGKDAILALAGHTVAAKLFGHELLKRHFGFCGTVAARVPVFRLSYPWRPEALPRVARAVRAALS